MPATYQYAKDIWIAVWLVWLITAVFSKRAVRIQAIGSRLVHIAVMVAAFALMFSTILRVGPLAWRFLPDSPAVGWTGLAITAAGCTFAVWARLMLGGNWSASVTLKQDHRLIRRGPYRIVRHPIYAGFLVGLFGTALTLGQVGPLAGLLLAFIGWRSKSRLEEQFLTEQFGADYATYQREVKALIPFVL